MEREHERSFDLFGSRVRILIGAPLQPDTPAAELAALRTEMLLRRLHLELSRFEPDSELSALNGSPHESVGVTPALAALVGAALDARLASDGLVDACVVDPLERAGYRDSHVGRTPAPLREALDWAPPRTPASPAPGDRWEKVSVDLAAGLVSRPPGFKLDSGGLGKGLAADLAAARLGGYSSFAVDCGGDLRIGGASSLPRRVELDHPLVGGEAMTIRASGGGIATSGLRKGIWRTAEGFAHHLIDPRTGMPAWTGVIQATALAPTATQAEVFAKAALLAGPERGHELLEPGGGVIVLDSGAIEVAGCLQIADARSVVAV